MPATKQTDYCKTALEKSNDLKISILKKIQIDEMHRLVADPKPEDRFVFFFAGHGDQR